MLIIQGIATPKTTKAELTQIRTREPINVTNNPRESNSFGVILAIIVLLAIGTSIYFIISAKRTGKRNFITDLGDKFQQWSEESKCASLRRKLLLLLKHQEDVADRLLNHAKLKYPGHPEHWYYEKVIHDLKRDRV
ncbi:MAG: hypothetical protein F6K35_32945 [Okeania sp. SIO2H7]|nr:hypothetical protein [Okeania sp. SIO2H7]